MQFLVVFTLQLALSASIAEDARSRAESDADIANQLAQLQMAPSWLLPDDEPKIPRQDTLLLIPPAQEKHKAYHKCSHLPPVLVLGSPQPHDLRPAPHGPTRPKYLQV